MSAVDKNQDLPPCPFCGEDADLHSRDNRPATFAQNDTDHWISCNGDDCMASVGMAATREEVIAAWNRRADLAAPSAPAEVEGLVERLRSWPKGLVAPGEPIMLTHAMEILKEAATALTAQQAENERLRGEVAEEKEMLEQSFQASEDLAVMLAKANARAEKAEAERDAWKSNAADLAGNLDRIHDELPTGQDWHVSKVLYEHKELKGEV